MNIDAFTQYLEAGDKSPRTTAGYARDLRTFVVWFEQSSGKAPDDTGVTPLDAREYRQYLHLTKKMKPASVNRKLAALRAYFRWAQDAGRIASNPLRNIRDVRQASSRSAPRWLTRQETYALLRAASKAVQLAEAKGRTMSANEARRDKAILALFLHAGLRVSELCALEKGDIVIKARSGLVIVRSGKGGKYREVPLNKDARQALAVWMARPAAGSRLFTGRRGKPLQPRGVQRIIERLAAAAQLEPNKVTPHALRHTFGKSLVDAGVSLDKVAALMGHSNLNTTKIYTRPSQADLSAAVERVAWGNEE